MSTPWKGEVMNKKIVFSPYFDAEKLFADYEADASGLWTAEFFEGPNFRRNSLRKFLTITQAKIYANKVIERYKRIIVVAELAFILNKGAERGEPITKLDPDYKNVIDNADQAESPAEG